MTEPEVPQEANDADAVEQLTPVEEAAPFSGTSRDEEAAEGDLAESAVEVPMGDEDERRES